MSEVLHTKFGNCSLNNVGHYRVTSRNEENHGKLLHRLVWEDFYGCEVPKGFVIHHKNGNKLDNCILNLQLMRDKEHRSFHNTGKDNSNENNPMWNKSHKYKSKIKMSQAKNKSGFFRVYKSKEPRTSQGFGWRYEIKTDDMRKTFVSVDLLKLKEKVIANGFDWIVVNEDNAQKTCDELNIDYEELK